MGDVQIAAENDRFGQCELVQVLAERGVPFEAVGQAAQAILGVDRIDVHEVEIGILKGDHAAFLVVLIDAESMGDLDWRFPGENRGAGVAGLFRRVPERLVSSEFQRQFHLLLARLRFLKAKYVGIFGGEEIGQAFVQCGTDAVHVPGDQFHKTQNSKFNIQGEVRGQ